MEPLAIILPLLAAVVASDVIARAAPVPLPIVQIALGAAIVLLFGFHVVLQPEMFLLLFIAPLLFLDGWRIPKEGFQRDRWTILALAFGLVVFTVLGAGVFIHWLIPSMPLAVAFALASVLSPTDAVAVSAIAQRTPIPKRLMTILEGESLLNDASGLVCLRFAVAAALTGAFSIVEAPGVLLWLAVAGVAIGVGVAVLANAAKDLIVRHFGEETGSQILVSLLIPFSAYMLAEQLEASGILASVAAGLAMSREERSGRALAVTRVRRAAVWDVVQFAGNGVIFVLLGQQLPAIIAGAGQTARETGQAGALRLVVLVAAISPVLLALRALWVWATLALILFWAGGRRTIQAPGWRLVATMALAGARGAVTLAGAMTIPLALPDGSPFPARDLVILLAAGVIVVSLVTADLALPRLMHGVTLPLETQELLEKDAARLAAWRAAIEALKLSLDAAERERPRGDLALSVGARLITHYQERVESHVRSENDPDLTQKTDDEERSLRLVALRAERDTLYSIARSGKLSDESTRALVREVDLREARLASS